ncbi:MAG: hypothetical protein C5B52_14250 [Bacteroidetes bacterium]|nr:MAG: hypothetical protein C5B52_14250 [Bacteroidota bacterium]
MRLALTLTALACLFLFSCQKELSFENGGNPGGGGSNGTLLVKILSESPDGNLTTEYSYDPSYRLNGQTVTGTRSGTDKSSQIKISRNALGFITKILTTSAQLSGVGLDSAVFTVYNDPITAKYTYSKSIHKDVGLPTIDSEAYVYDGAGRINAVEYYVGTVLDFPIYVLTTKLEIAYDSKNNITGLNVLAPDPNNPGSMNTAGIYKLTYDDKENPLPLGNDAVVLSNYTLYSSNNNIKMEFTNPSYSLSNFTVTSDITYNSSKKPDKSVVTLMPDNTVTNQTYFYQ